MKHRLFFVIYLALVVVGTMVHDPLILAAAALIILAGQGPRALRMAFKVLRAIGPFALAVSLGYVLMARDNVGHAWSTLLLINTRVFTLTLLTFTVFQRLDMPRVFAFSPTLSFVLVLTTSQVLTFRRLFVDFRQALASRSPHRVGLLTALRHGAATSVWFLRRAEHDATEITQALEVRGFFLDRH